MTSGPLPRFDAPLMQRRGRMPTSPFPPGWPLTSTVASLSWMTALPNGARCTTASWRPTFCPLGRRMSLRRRAVCGTCGGFDPELSTLADWDFNVRLSAAGPAPSCPNDSWHGCFMARTCIRRKPGWHRSSPTSSASTRLRGQPRECDWTESTGFAGGAKPGGAREIAAAQRPDTGSSGSNPEIPRCLGAG